MIMKRLSALSILLPIGALALSSCKSGLSCGEGTTEAEGECRVDSDSMGGASSRDLVEIEIDDFEGISSVAPVSETALMAAWIPSVDDDVSYNIYVATSKDGFNYAQPQVEVPAGASTAVVAGLESEAKLFVQVQGVLDGEVVLNSKTLELTLAADDEVPEFAGATDAEPAEGAGVKVSWDPATDNLTPQEGLVYLVYGGESEEDVDYRTPLGVSLPGATSATVYFEKPESEYFVAVRAQDAAGLTDENRTAIAAMTGEDVEAPQFSGCSSVVARSASTIVASWKPAVDAIFPAEDLVYNLYAAKSVDEFNFRAPDAVIKGETSGVIPNLERDTPYLVVCRAADPGKNEEENSLMLSARTKADAEPPTFEGPIAAAEVGTTTATLSWSPGSDNKSDPADLVYFAYVSEFEEDLLEFDPNEFPALAESAPGKTELALEGLQSNTVYYAVVLARDGGDNYSAPIAPIALTTRVSFSIDVLSGIIGAKGCTAGVGCHGGATPGGELLLEPEFAYQQLVDTPAESPRGAGGSFLRVKPGDAENSHLIHRIKGTGPIDQSSGATIEDLMPRDGNLLSDEQINTVERWINQGAEEN